MATVSRLDVDIGAKTDKLKSGIKKAEGQLNDFGTQVKRIGGLLVAAFSVQAIVRFGAEASRLAGQMQGVEAAFKRLNQPGLLDDLKKATRGTVSELELMQKAVMADNFRIPLDVFAQGLKFATRRAKETGQEVDYLVNSFVTGIGRKSQLVMDNLGISVLELQEEIKNTGDFATAVGVIMSREMASAGEDIDTSAEKTARLKAEMSNLKVEIGQGLNPVLDTLREKLINLFTDTTKGEGVSKAEAEFRQFKESIKDLSKEAAADAIGAKLKDTKKKVDEFFQSMEGKSNRKQRIDAYQETMHWLTTLQTKLEDLQKPSTGKGEVSAGPILKGLKAELELLKTSMDDATDPKKIQEYVIEIGKIENQIADLTKTEADRLKEAAEAQAKILKLRTDFISAMKESVALEKEEAKHFSDMADLQMSNMESDRSAFTPDLDFQSMLETDALDIANSKLDDFVKGLQDKASQIQILNDVIVQSITDMFVSIGEGLGKVAISKSMEGFFDNILSTMADFAVQFGTLLIAMGAARVSLDFIGESGIGAIAAGTALVALGTAANAKLAEIANSDLSSGGGSSPQPASYGAISGGQAFSSTVKISGRELAIITTRGQQTINGVT